MPGTADDPLELAINTPPNSARSAIVRARDAVAIALIAGVVMSPSLLGPINTYDAGLAGSSGTFLLHGQLPYRDFWWLYGPLSPVVVALLTAIFGPSLLLLRLLGLALLMAQAGLGYALLRTKVDHLPSAMIAIGSVSAGVLLLGLEISAWSLSLTFALASLAVRSVLPSRPALAGILAGCAFAARFDVGGYVLLACLALGNRRMVIAGFLLIAAPVLAALVMVTPLESLYEQLVWFPVVGQRQFRALPGPRVADAIALLVYLPIVAIPKLAILAAAIRLLVGQVRPPTFLLLVLFATFCQLQTQGRADIGHQAQAATPGFLLLGVWLVDLTRGPTGAPSFPAKIRPQRAAVLSVVGISCAIAFAIASLNVWRIPSGPLSATDAAFVAGVRTLASNTSRADAIFVGLTSHRYTTVNAMLAYYLADRRAGVKVAMFNPGITNTERVQREMVQELLNTNTQILMLDAKAALISEQTNDSRILGSDVLDTYISANFVLVCTFGDTRVLAARERASIVTCADTTNERLLDVLAGIGPTR